MVGRQIINDLTPDFKWLGTQLLDEIPQYPAMILYSILHYSIVPNYCMNYIYSSVNSQLLKIMCLFVDNDGQ